MSEVPIDTLLQVAHEVANAARPIPLRYFRKKIKVETKADASPVTVADKETEIVMREVLSRHFPDHGVFGEEHGQARLDSRYVWVLDPIDGTRSFIAGMPLFGTLIALLDQGVPVIGIVDIPAMSERYVGVKGRPSTFNGEEIETASTDRLDNSLLFPAMHDRPQDCVRQSFDRASAAARDTRHGYDCYIYAQLAAGHIDAIIENGLAPYDFLALVPLVEGAGGRVTDWRGQPLTLESNEFIAASSTPKLHEELIGLLDSGM